VEVTINHKIQHLKDKLKENPLLMIDAEMLKIADKQGNTINLVLNSVQLKLYSFISKWYGKRPLRILVLKARKQGISTEVEGITYALTSLSKNCHSLIIADTKDSADYIFGMCKFFHENMVNDFPMIVPEIKKDNAKMLEFNGTNSKIMVKVENEIRAFTFRIVHCSEVAFFSNPRKVFTSLNNAIPKADNSILILETTANGVGNYFHSQWRRALSLSEWEKSSDIDYVKIFFAWFDSDDNEMDLYDGEKIVYPEKHIDKLIEMKKRYNLSDKKMKWYLSTLKNECGGDLDTMHQEHPSNDQEAFLSAGTPIFNAQLLFDMYDAEEKNEEQNVYKKYKIIDHYDTFKLQVGEENGVYGDFQVYQTPIIKQKYAMSIDTAEGVEGGDSSICNIFNVLTGEQVLNFVWDGDLSIFTDKCFKLAKIYNNCVIIPERNNHGHAFIALLREKHNYSNIWQFPEDEKDGFPTNILSRVKAIEITKRYINDGYLKLHSLHTISEMLSFVNYRGKMQASVGNHDDEVATVWVYCYALDSGLLSMSMSENMREHKPLTYKEICAREGMQPQKNTPRRVTGY